MFTRLGLININDEKFYDIEMKINVYTAPRLMRLINIDQENFSCDHKIMIL